MANLLSSSQIDYKMVETPRGTWRRYMYPSGLRYSDFTSSTTVLGMPLLHYTSGISPETGTFTPARGFVAVGRRAIGVIAIGRLSAGVIAVGQLSAGLVAVGQAAFGVAALGQFAIALALGIGQIAAGLVAIGQLAIGKWVLAQLGVGEHVWSMAVKDPQAIDFFKSLAARLGRVG